jgi:hypothetical protein
LRQIMSQGRKRIGLFIGAGAPTSIRVDDKGKIDPAGSALIPDVAGLTGYVLEKLTKDDRAIVDGIIEGLKKKPGKGANIEAILTQVRRLAQAIPDGLVSLLDVLPVLRTGEAIVTGEAAKLPMRCRITLPEKKYQPRSSDPKVTERWGIPRRAEGYDRVVASWRAQSPRAVAKPAKIEREKVEDKSVED